MSESEYNQICLKDQYEDILKTQVLSSKILEIYNSMKN